MKLTNVVFLKLFLTSISIQSQIKGLSKFCDLSKKCYTDQLKLISGSERHLVECLQVIRITDVDIEQTYAWGGQCFSVQCGCQLFWLPHARCCKHNFGSQIE